MKPLLTILLFVPSMVLFGQTNDSIALFDSILDKSNELKYQGKLDSALLLSKRLHVFLKQNISDEQRIDYVTNHASLLDNVDQAIVLLTKEQEYHAKKKNYKNLARIYYSIGGTYFDNFNDRDALINYIKADSIFEQINQEQWLAVMAKVGIANVLMKSDYKTDSEKFDQAVPYIDEGIALADSIDFLVGSSILLEKKGHYLQLKDSLDASIEIYKKALKVSQSINYTLRESSIYDGMGRVFVKLQNIDSAAYYFEKHLEIIEASDYSIDIAEANYNLGQFYNQISKFQMAKNHLEEAWRIVEELSNVRKEYPYKIHNELAIAYAALDEPKKAYASLSAAKDLQEEVYNIRNSERISEVETKYRTEKKEQEIAILKSKNGLAEQQKKSQRNILLGGIGLMTLAGIFLYALYKNRLRTNQKLREIDTLKSNFFTNISHEFRTPLALISAPIQESLEENDLSEEKRNHFQIAQKNAQRLSALINQLLELSKIDSGKRQLTLEKIKPTQLISAWTESFLYLSQQKNIVFALDIHDKEIEAWCDREALENITTNLLGNAIKYTPENGTIKLNAVIRDNELKIEVSNSGNGLTNAQLKTIFNRFYQTDDYSEGAGIGLSLVKELVELHGGSIVATSTPNELTLFTALLSLDPKKLKNVKIREHKSTSSVIVPAKGQNSIPKLQGTENKEMPILLVVEDNVDMRTVLSDTFKSTYQVLLAENGEMGIATAIEQIPNIIISDLMMPIKDGIELTKTLKEDERTSHIPIILLTAKAGDENELIGIDVGADDYITKPFNGKILKSKANSLIELRQRLQSRYSQEVILKPKDIAITSIDERFLEKVQEVLDEKLIESTFTIEEFSSAVNMSRMQLHRKLKALTGLSASEFIRSQRLKLAAQLLKQSDSNVSQVGYSVGFNDHAYFSKCFKEVFNSTPSEFASRR